MYRISTSYPLPMNGTQGGRGYPWTVLKVGESFLIKEPPKRIDNQCHLAGKRHGKRFVYRKTLQGVRVWRAK
jgi:hypothetical protein